MKKKIFIFFFLLIVSLAGAADIKDADLAGSWYPSSKDELSSLLQRYLDNAKPEKVDGKIFAIISPHAGYRFSGEVAAYGYKLAGTESVKTVVLIGFSHRRLFDGIAIYDAGVFRTPLGEISVDSGLASDIKAASPKFIQYREAFSGENSVEMQIPFIQMAFKKASIVPIAFGGQSFDDAEILAGALAGALNGREDYVIVASTDLSHYHSYEKAKAIDKHLIALLDTKKAKDLFEEAKLGICELCGLMPVTSVLLAADKLGFDGVRILRYANSGDTSGDKSRVVGYLSAVIFKRIGQAPVAGNQMKSEKEGDRRMMLNKSERGRLLQIARESITSYIRDGKNKSFSESDPVLNEPMGAFVTLHEKGQLRGCIGNMVGHGPLYQTVADMAIQAATGDPRFPALQPSDIDKVDIEISVLSPMKKVASPEEVKVPGHGVVVKRGFHSGVYLPQVATETGWSREQFLSSLCAHKAGLPPDSWKDPATDIYIFTAEVFGEVPAHSADNGGSDEK